MELRFDSQRELVTQARVNPNTVQRAYREMEWMGLVKTSRGQGTFEIVGAFFGEGTRWVEGADLETVRRGSLQTLTGVLGAGTHLLRIELVASSGAVLMRR